MPSLLLRFSLAVTAIGVAASTFALVPPEDAGAAASETTPTVSTAGPSGYDPPIQPPSEEAERAIAAFRIPEGMQASLVAAEPDLANPVAFSIDDQGRYYVCETFRQGNAVVDNRGRDYWLLDDLAAQTVEDRLAYYKKHLGEEGLKAFTEHHDRIRLLTDTNGDGVVDKSQVFADGFNAPEDGTGAGVLKVGDDVFYTNIPHLWRLKDTNGDGVADEQESLASGFGVRVAFRGHDMHGLVMGPDGRLYFSIGDRGFNVTTKEGKRLVMPDQGAVLRCETDGSNLEVFASGLRNPQELAFDDYGNLFTGDNNSDSGDRARWVYVAEGSDSGWRMYYQYLDDRGPWNRELMWLPYETPAFENPIATGLPTGVAVKDMQPAYILPPVTNLGDGPSGLTHYPGVGLSDRYKDHFFLCDFRGTPNNSGVRSFAVQPKGAGFELVDSHEFIWSILATDADFAPDGRFVIADWVDGWNGEGKGRLYAFSDPVHTKAGEESAKLLAEDFSERTPEQLIDLFSHRDRRVRQKAQFALVFEMRESLSGDWKQAQVELVDLVRVMERGKRDQVSTQLHFVWALGQIARSGHEKARDFCNGMLWILYWKHSEPVIRAAAIRAFRESQPRLSDEQLIESHAASRGPSEAALKLIGKHLSDDDIRVRIEAARYAATLSKEFAEAIIAALKDSSVDDAVARNALTVSLSEIERRNPGFWRTVQDHESAPVRVALVAAMRRSALSSIGSFLSDSDASVVTEAARAINDVPVDDATPQLAALAGKAGLNEPTLRRVLNANFRLGSKSNAEAVAKVAASGDAASALRVEALTELKLWADPPKTDRVTGMYRHIEPRDASFVAEVVRPLLADLLAAQESSVRQAAIELVSTYKLQEAAPLLTKIATDADRGGRERIAALKGLTAIEAEGLNGILTQAVKDNSAEVRSEARSLWAAYDPEAAVPVLDQTIVDGEMIEKQSAIVALASLENAAADAVLARWFDKFVSGQTPDEIGLELLEAAEQRESLHGRLEAYNSGRSADDPLTAWQVSLSGGDAEKGKDIFFNRASVSCQRCHKADNGRGGEVGPDLSKIGATKDRAYLLESIVTPNSKIAENFESVIVVTTEGQVITGVKRADDENALTLITAEGKGIVIPKDEIEEQAVGKSAMPDDLIKHLSKRDVRDLVEYMAGQK